MNTQNRQKSHQRNTEVEELLKELNGLLAIAENEVKVEYEAPKYPCVFVVGCARSGTTLLMQHLASLNIFAYPSNLMSRFYDTPAIGAKLHHLLINLDSKKEVFGRDQTTYFESNLGKTKGAASPHEFWYFWRRFFKFREIQQLSEAELNNVHLELFLKDLAKIEQVFNRPLLMKAMILNWHLSHLAKLLPKAIFIFVQRNPLYVMQSLWKARLDFFGDINQWYSFKPPEYWELKNKSVYEQLAGQVFYTNQAISKELAKIDDDHKIFLEYEDFCQDPENILETLKEKMKDQDFDSTINESKKSIFQNTNKISINATDFKKLESAYQAYL